MFVLVIAIAATFMLHVWMRTLVISEGFKLGETRSRLIRLESDRVNLRLEREKLISPERLNAIVQNFAADGNVFVSPNASQILFYDEGTSGVAHETPGIPAR
jgi:hypothetical protein